MDIPSFNPGVGIYKVENFIFSSVSSLRSWHSWFAHLSIWRLRNTVYLDKVCISYDRAVPTPGFKLCNLLGTFDIGYSKPQDPKFLILNWNGPAVLNGWAYPVYNQHRLQMHYWNLWIELIRSWAIVINLISNFWNYPFWLRITDKGSVPEMRI